MAFTWAGPARAGQPPAADEHAFVHGGAALVAVFEQPNFGGYFCCDAGGLSAGLFIDGGVFLLPRLSLRGELAIPAAETDHLRAPRFVQENRHRDPTLSALVGYHLARGRRAGLALLAGAGIAASRTSRTSTLLTFTPDGSFPDPSTTTILNGNETRFALTFGGDVPIDFTDRVGLVATARLRWIDRSDEARYQDGLGPWLLMSGAGVRVRF